MPDECVVSGAASVRPTTAEPDAGSNQSPLKRPEGDQLFRPGGAVTLADVKARVAEEPPSLRRRDTLSALRVLFSRVQATDALPATAEAVRRLFAENGPTALGVTELRWRNVRSLVVAAIKQHGMRRRMLTKDLPLSLAWDTLFKQLKREERHALARLARYCTVVGIGPSEVDKETLLGLHEALVAESFVKNPRNILKHTIAVANMAGKRISGEWPLPKLSSPFKTEPFMLPLSAFPASFGADAERWVTSATTADPLDLRARTKAARPATIKSAVYHIRRAASALVRGGHLPIEEITSLAVLVQPLNFVNALRAFMPSDATLPPTDAARIARTLIGIAKIHVPVTEADLVQLKAVLRRLHQRLPPGMGKRHRERVEQFDNPDNVQRLLHFPADEAARARTQRNPERRARGIERSLATAVLIDTGLRLHSLRTLRLDMSFRRANGTVYLHVHRDQSKTDRPLDHILPPATVVLLDEYLRDHRPILPGSDGPYLFPGKTGGPKSESAMRNCISEPLYRHTGIRLNPHAFRHVIGKIVIERDPGAYALISRHLGHTSLNTTLGSYLGTETKVASRHLHKIIDEARSGLPTEV
ncbi:tyrosine-type recombinase/integrase [Mongoliimonas terrestris]|uniref:tyrosine-type recombinase/integrase n=1 Tax=Mongoliimonas terrestris TaxID=1709001 RepID=UPI001588161D|nr:site-specific integrase [Mongoliimonas terrestris]